MADQVLSVHKVDAPVNQASLPDRIEAIYNALYSCPDWVRKGLNWVINQATGEAVNLNQLATQQLESEGPRNDAVAVVQKPTGEKETVFIGQDVVAAAGNDLNALKSNLQRAINDSQGNGRLLMFAAIGVGAFLLLRRR